jgi:hypothetical protein
MKLLPDQMSHNDYYNNYHILLITYCYIYYHYLNRRRKHKNFVFFILHSDTITENVYVQISLYIITIQDRIFNN